MIHRHYKLLTDFKRVSDFLCSNYTIKELNGYLLQPFFEYAHTHPYFNHKLTHRFGLWEDNGNIVAIVCYEMDLGESFLSVKSGYEYLLPDLIKHSESELAVIKDTKHMLGIWVTDTQSIYIKLLKENGYQKVHSEPVTIFSYDNDFLDVRLPDSFSAISLEDENDFIKINECIWKGFNPGDEPDNDLDGMRLMQSGPSFRPDLTTIIKAPNGDYACYAGMWFEEKNGYAYLEPLATVPQYRRLGLATFAVTKSMKKTKKLGAKYCFGGVVEFYKVIGFQTICNRELWKKEW